MKTYVQNQRNLKEGISTKNHQTFSFSNYELHAVDTKMYTNLTISARDQRYADHKENTTHNIDTRNRNDKQ